VENVIRENQLGTVKEVASLLDISVGSVHHIIHDELKFQKVCARWVPKRLTPEMKERHVDACQELMLRYEADGEAFLQRIVTGDETSTSQNESDKAWSGATPRLQNRRRCGCNDLQAKSC